VFWSVLGDTDQQEATAAALQRARPRIRAAMGDRVRLKYLPDLVFEFDESIDRGFRMEELLRRIGEEGDDGSGSVPAEGG
jgi:ribosome-binding factor A